MEKINEEQAHAKIEEMVRRILEKFNPEKIILFGSWASGTASPDSDVDLLVVMPVHGSRRAKAMEIDYALADRELPLDLIVVTPEQFEREKKLIGTIIHPAALEGKILYERIA